MDLEPLIRHIAEEALKRLREERSRKMVILISDSADKLLERLANKLSSFEIVKCSPGALSCEEALEYLQRCDAVVCMLSLSLAGKIASLDDEVGASKLALRALLAGKRVIGVTDALESSQSAPRALSVAVEERLRALRAFDVRLAKLECIEGELSGNAPAKGLITEDDILAHGAGVIRAPRGTVITPLARDRASEKGIEIIIE